MLPNVAREELGLDAAKILVGGVVVSAIELNSNGGESTVAVGMPARAIHHGHHVYPLRGSGDRGVAIDLGDRILMAEDNDFVDGEKATEIVAFNGAEFPSLEMLLGGYVTIDRPDPVGGETPDGIGEASDLVLWEPPVGRAS